MTKITVEQSSTDQAWLSKATKNKCSAGENRRVWRGKRAMRSQATAEADTRATGPTARVSAARLQHRLTQVGPEKLTSYCLH